MGLFPKLLLFATLYACHWHPGKAQVSDYKGIQDRSIPTDDKSNENNICKQNRGVDIIPSQWVSLL
jgi:hypothetical protein